MVKEITDVLEFESLLAQAKKNNQAVYIKFGAEWCVPCKKMKPVFEKLSKEHKDDIFLEVDIDEMKEIAEEYSIENLPTISVIKDNIYKVLMYGGDNNKLLNLFKKK
jgi:thioredoxin 1